MTDKPKMLALVYHFIFLVGGGEVGEACPLTFLGQWDLLALIKLLMVRQVYIKYMSTKWPIS